MTLTRKPKASSFFRFLLPALGAPLFWILAFPLGSLPGIPIFAFFALALLYVAGKHNKLGLTILVFSCTGLLSTFVGASWLASIHVAALLLATLYKIFWFALAGLAIGFQLRLRPKALRVIAFALLWVLFDAANHASAWSFPYLCLPYSFAGSRAGLALAGLGSLYSISFTLALSAGTLAELAESLPCVKGRSRLAVFAGLFGILCFIALFVPGQNKAIKATETEDRDKLLSVALIQSNHYAFEPSFRDYELLFEKLSRLTTKALAEKPDLVVWHETAIIPPVLWYQQHFGMAESYQYSQRVLDYIGNLPVPLLTGMTWIDLDDKTRTREYNAAVLFSPESEPAVYKKMRLVPFAEYFPLTKELPGLTRALFKLFGPLRSPGTEPTTFSVKGLSFAAPICFEDSYPSVFRKFGKVSAYIVITEDSWSRSLAMKRQHLAMSRLRAAETGAYVLRASNSGISALIGPDGSLLAELPPEEEGVLVARIPIGKNAKHSAWFVFLPLAALGFALLLALHLVLESRIDKKGKLHHTGIHTKQGWRSRAR